MPQPQRISAEEIEQKREAYKERARQAVLEAVESGQNPNSPELVPNDDLVLTVVREEISELAVRLERFGVQLRGREQIEIADNIMAVLGGLLAGGASATR